MWRSLVKRQIRSLPHSRATGRNAPEGGFSGLRGFSVQGGSGALPSLSHSSSLPHDQASDAHTTARAMFAAGQGAGGDGGEGEGEVVDREEEYDEEGEEYDEEGEGEGDGNEEQVDEDGNPALNPDHWLPPNMRYTDPEEGAADFYTNFNATVTPLHRQEHKKAMARIKKANVRKEDDHVALLGPKPSDEKTEILIQRLHRGFLGEKRRAFKQHNVDFFQMEKELEQLLEKARKAQGTEAAAALEEEYVDSYIAYLNKIKVAREERTHPNQDIVVESNTKRSKAASDPAVREKLIRDILAPINLDDPEVQRIYKQSPERTVREIGDRFGKEILPAILPGEDPDDLSMLESALVAPFLANSEEKLQEVMAPFRLRKQRAEEDDLDGQQDDDDDEGESRGNDAHARHWAQGGRVMGVRDVEIEEDLESEEGRGDEDWTADLEQAVDKLPHLPATLMFHREEATARKRFFALKALVDAGRLGGKSKEKKEKKEKRLRGVKGAKGVQGAQGAQGVQGGQGGEGEGEGEDDYAESFSKEIPGWKRTKKELLGLHGDAGRGLPLSRPTDLTQELDLMKLRLTDPQEYEYQLVARGLADPYAMLTANRVDEEEEASARGAGGEGEEGGEGLYDEEDEDLVVGDFEDELDGDADEDEVNALLEDESQVKWSENLEERLQKLESSFDERSLAYLGAKRQAREERAMKHHEETGEKDFSYLNPDSRTTYGRYNMLLNMREMKQLAGEYKAMKDAETARKEEALLRQQEADLEAAVLEEAEEAEEKNQPQVLQAENREQELAEKLNEQKRNEIDRELEAKGLRFDPTMGQFREKTRDERDSELLDSFDTEGNILLTRDEFDMLRDSDKEVYLESLIGVNRPDIEIDDQMIQDDSVPEVKPVKMGEKEIKERIHRLNSVPDKVIAGLNEGQQKRVIDLWSERRYEAYDDELVYGDVLKTKLHRRIFARLNPDVVIPPNLGRVTRPEALGAAAKAAWDKVHPPNYLHFEDDKEYMNEDWELLQRFLQEADHQFLGAEEDDLVLDDVQPYRHYQMKSVKEELAEARRKEASQESRGRVLNLDPGSVGDFSLGALLHEKHRSKKTKTGLTMKITKFIIAGNGRGMAGFGIGRAKDDGIATDRALKNLYQNLLIIPLREDRTLFTDCRGHHNGTHCVIRQRAYGGGLRCSDQSRFILEAFGLRDAACSVWGSNRKPQNQIFAIFHALTKQVSQRERSLTRGKNYYKLVDAERETFNPPSAESVRRRAAAVQAVLADTVGDWRRRKIEIAQIRARKALRIEFSGMLESQFLTDKAAWAAELTQGTRPYVPPPNDPPPSNPRNVINSRSSHTHQTWRRFESTK